ncbi:MAG: ABC transporter substrate-binding protein [Candidatus Cloacimonas sp.]|jgi:ABC-type nitrate/sulfonate/bicarbonate transport system substrate-binding protein|nr:ABC transporter substrate-binding protein [Candidatus Cloacimonas sp.]
MRFIKLIIALLLITFTLSSCKQKETPAKPLEKVTITLDWTPNTNHTGLYVAKELGYYSAEGLDVEIQQPGQGVTDQIVAAGKSQFGVSYQENVIRARSENIPLVSIAAIIQHNTSGFASLKPAGINSPKDFAGKRYGSWDSPSEQAILKTIMAKNQADYAAITTISGVYDFFSTIGKDADFEWIYYGWDGVEAQRRGIEINYIPLKDLDPVFDYYTPVIITNEKLLADNPDLAKKFMTATAKGYEYCISNPKEAADILMKQVPELNADQVKLSMDFLAKEYQADVSQWGYQKSEVWQRFSDWMYKERLIPVAVEIDKSFSNQYLPQK